MSTSERPQGPGRPRDRRITDDAINAALAILSSDEALSIEAVARRAKISRPAIYKRWPTLAELVLDVAIRARDQLQATAPPMTLVAPDTGSLAGDLAAYTSGGMALLDQLDRVRITRPLLAESIQSRSLAAVVREELFAGDEAILRAIFDRAEARGEVRGGHDVMAVFHTLVGFALFRKFMLDLSLDDGSLDNLCRLLVQGMAGRSSDG